MKRNNKYRCKYDNEWLINNHFRYVCPSCGIIYKEINTKPKEIICGFPICDTYLKELQE